MLLRDWQLWHSYLTHLSGEKLDLVTVARALVESGVAESAFLSDGTTFWRSEDEGVGTSEARLKMEPGGSSARFSLPGAATPFAKECLYQASWFQYAERRVFGENAPSAARYVRAFLGQCHLRKGNHATGVYPILRVDEFGILSITFRVFSPPDPLPLDGFIDEYLNVGLRSFETAWVPPGIGLLAPSAYQAQVDASARGRATVHQLRMHAAGMTALTEERQEGDFVYRMAPLTTTPGEPETLQSLALTIMSVTVYVMEGTLPGERSAKPRVQFEDWSAWPHVFLIRFDDQAVSASENVDRHGTALRAILGRSSRPIRADKMVLTNDRYFDDYAVLQDSVVTLWVYGRTFLEDGDRSPWRDRNYGHLIYEQEVITEQAEHIEALYRHLLLAARSAEEDPAQVFQAQEAVSEIETSLRHAAYAGEIRDFLARGLELKGVPELRRLIHEWLELRRTVVLFRRQRETERFGWLLTTVFGLLAVPGIAGVLEPLARHFKWPLPADPGMAAPVLDLVALGIVVGALLAGRSWLTWNQRREAKQLSNF